MFCIVKNVLFEKVSNFKRIFWNYWPLKLCRKILEGGMRFEEFFHNFSEGFRCNLSETKVVFEEYSFKFRFMVKIVTFSLVQHGKFLDFPKKNQKILIFGQLKSQTIKSNFAPLSLLQFTHILIISIIIFYKFIWPYHLTHNQMNETIKKLDKVFSFYLQLAVDVPIKNGTWWFYCNWWFLLIYVFR